jgi:hypothetical protein
MPPELPPAVLQVLMQQVPFPEQQVPALVQAADLVMATALPARAGPRVASVKVPRLTSPVKATGPGMADVIPDGEPRGDEARRMAADHKANPGRQPATAAGRLTSKAAEHPAKMAVRVVGKVLRAAGLMARAIG